MKTLLLLMLLLLLCIRSSVQQGTRRTSKTISMSTTINAKLPPTLNKKQQPSSNDNKPCFSVLSNTEMCEQSGYLLMPKSLFDNRRDDLIPIEGKHGTDAIIARIFLILPVAINAVVVILVCILLSCAIKLERGLISIYHLRNHLRVLREIGRSSSNKKGEKEDDDAANTTITSRSIVDGHRQ